MAWGELFAIASMVVAAAALIGLFDFIDRNIDETLTLDEAWGEWPAVPGELAPGRESHRQGDGAERQPGAVTHKGDASHPSRGGA